MKKPKSAISLVLDALKKRTWQLKDNSNTQMSPSLVDLFISSRAIEDFALNNFYSTDVLKAHAEGLIYIHTLHGAFKPYCNGIDTRIVMLDGLRFPHCNSAPAKHFSSAVFQTMAFMFYTQLFFAGAQAMDYYNWFLAPYLRFEKLEYKEIKQILQGFVFQLNQSNRTGAQSAFTNIGLRINCPSYLEKEPAIYAGKKLDQTYCEFREEARMLYKALMEIMAEGDGRGAPFTFPIITTAITKDLDWNDPLVDVTLEAAASTGSPYFFNLTTDFLDEKYVHAMCCRLLVEHSGGVWMAGGLGSGSNKVVTINLPHVALISKDEKDFYIKLNKAIDIARKALLQSNKAIKKCLDDWQVLPWLKMKTNDGAPYYNFRDRRLTVGVIGMNECLLDLLKVKLSDEAGLKFAREIISHISDVLKGLSEKDGVFYTLEQTPAEAASHTLALKDKAKFKKKANVQGSGKEVYYSNSTHVPYSENIPLFDKVNIEAEFHPYFNGGTICHIFMGESRPNIGSLKDLVKKLAATKLAYFTFSPDYSICENDHFSRGKLEKCPKCGGKILDHINRIVGYFTKTSNWNPGKRREFDERIRFNIK